ncbi:hypothetical protein I4F81_011126 [Pyropia yezoensis]|uniref:Uncharacterized protein n=1 Tax=Pyropia yezoensis TaxID=2788 RepID=A0ACC3CFU1_PYRYE|nr:hypothetical protein I4F81_011126 [Neopyropia yezoensis]
MAGHNRVSLTSQQTAAIKEMASESNSNGAIAAALDVKRSTVAHVAKMVRRGAGSRHVRTETAPKNNDDLFLALCEEWTAIPDAFFKTLIDSMPRRVAAVIASKGNGIKY